MATNNLGAESFTAYPSGGDVMYQAYRHAKAEWDRVLYAPEYICEDVPAEVNDPLSDAFVDALYHYLIDPAADLRALATKLRVFRDEEAGGFYWGNVAVGALAADAHRLAFPAELPLA